MVLNSISFSSPPLSLLPPLSHRFLMTSSLRLSVAAHRKSGRGENDQANQDRANRGLDESGLRESGPRKLGHGDNSWAN